MQPHKFLCLEDGRTLECLYACEWKPSCTSTATSVFLLNRNVHIHTTKSIKKVTDGERVKSVFVTLLLLLLFSNNVFTTVKGRCLLASCSKLNWIIFRLRFRAVGIRSDPVPAGWAPIELRGLIFYFHSSHEVKPCQDCGKRARLD